MPNHTLTRSDLCDTLCKKLDVSRQQTVNLVESLLQEIANALVKEGHVKISSFGTFHIRKKSERIGRNPKTGKEVMITPRKSLSFRASHLLKESVNKRI
ncbi:MAG: integration host factor subunit alpha [Alphaproteobacteria bacterium]|nr:integration host factor subunit alpha [Alphaproteobacteria bacterium]